MTFGFEIIVIAAMLAVNAVFAAYEMALASISRARLSTLCQQKAKGAEQAAYMKDRMEASLAVVQLGITFAGAVAAATGGAGTHESLTPYLTGTLGISDPLAEVLSLASLVIPLSILTILFAELVPKMFALENKERVCLSLSPTMKVIADLAAPFVSFFETVVKKIMRASSGKFSPEAEGQFTDARQSLHELKAAAALAKASRLIGAREERIVLAAASLSTKPIRAIMIPAADISMIPLESSLMDALVKAHTDMHTRFPVCAKAEDPQTIQGYVNFKDIVHALKMSPSDPTLRGITRAIMKIPGGTPISEVLSQMIQGKVHIALVNSDQGRVLGLVTLEDIMKELVGDIEDEYDHLPMYMHPYGSGWIVGGGVPMKTVTGRLGLEIQSGKETELGKTLAEWCSEKAGKHLEGGEVIRDGRLSVVVRKLRRKKPAEVVVSLAP